MRSEAGRSEASIPLSCKGRAATGQVDPVSQGTAKPQGLLWSPRRKPVKADSIAFQGQKELERKTLELGQKRHKRLVGRVPNENCPCPPKATASQERPPGVLGSHLPPSLPPSSVCGKNKCKPEAKEPTQAAHRRGGVGAGEREGVECLGCEECEEDACRAPGSTTHQCGALVSHAHP